MDCDAETVLRLSGLTTCFTQAAASPPAFHTLSLQTSPEHPSPHFGVRGAQFHGVSSASRHLLLQGACLGATPAEIPMPITSGVLQVVVGNFGGIMEKLRGLSSSFSFLVSAQVLAGSTATRAQMQPKRELNKLRELSRKLS